MTCLPFQSVQVHFTRLVITYCMHTRHINTKVQDTRGLGCLGPVGALIEIGSADALLGGECLELLHIEQ